MRARGWVRAVLLCLLLWTGCARGEGDARCLLVGCDRFLTMPSTSPASANNVAVMEALLKDFLPGGVFITPAGEGVPSAEALACRMQEAFRGADEQDVCLLYLSTHGVRSRDAEEGTALLLSDGAEEEALSPGVLLEMLNRFPGRRILMVDACFSGGLTEAAAKAAEGCRSEDGPEILVSCGAEEDSWFWNAETEEVAGTGYFTAALNNALRASDPEQIDPDGDGWVTLQEATGRLRAMHGASTAACFPQTGEPLFRLPEDRKAGSLLRAVAFGNTEAEGDMLTLPISFRAEEPVRLIYLLVPSRGGRWDFEHAVRLPDREKTGLVRGLLSPGEKTRSIRLNRNSLGEDGRALLQIISLQGTEAAPWAEAGRMIENHPDGKEKTAAE